MTIKKKEILLSVLTGLLLALAYPLYNFEILAWMALVPLFFAIEKKSPMESFVLGWLTGFIMFIFQLFWLKVFHLSIPFAISAYLAFYFGLFCLLYNLVKTRLKMSLLLIAPFLWVSIEYIRTIGFWGFPAGLLGYSQYLNLPVIQIADITGVYGISFLIVLVNTAIYLLLKNISMVRKVKIAMGVAILILLVLAYGNSRPIKLGEPIRIAAIQPNITDRSYDIKNVLADLERMSLEAAKQKAGLIIWPETIVREHLRLSPDISLKVYQIIKKTDAYLLLGNHDVKDNKHYNCAFLFSPKGEAIGQYNKIHPIPLWENYPLRYWFPFLHNVEDKGRCDPGSDFTIFDIEGKKFGTLICFEGIFPQLSQKFVGLGAQFLVNISNDGWSQSVSEHYQHASMSVFRAVENRMFFVRVGNSGVTQVIDPNGKIIKELPIYTSGLLVQDIYPSLTKSFYGKYGDIFAYGCVIFSISMLAFSWRKRNEKN